MEDARPDWTTYFLNGAQWAGTRSSCLRRKVGAMIVSPDLSVISTGYNGAPKHQRNCLEIGFCYRNKHNIQSGTQIELCRASGSHAESNAIALAAKNGNSLKGCTIYIDGHEFICNQCKAMIANSGITKVIFRTEKGEIKIYIPEKDWKIHPIDQ